MFCGFTHDLMDKVTYCNYFKVSDSIRMLIQEKQLSVSDEGMCTDTD